MENFTKKLALLALIGVFSFSPLTADDKFDHGRGVAAEFHKVAQAEITDLTNGQNDPKSRYYVAPPEEVNNGIAPEGRNPSFDETARNTNLATTIALIAANCYLHKQLSHKIFGSLAVVLSSWCSFRTKVAVHAITAAALLGYTHLAKN